MGLMSAEYSPKESNGDPRFPADHHPSTAITPYVANGALNQRTALQACRGRFSDYV
jgi:hypothetical protein